MATFLLCNVHNLNCYLYVKSELVCVIFESWKIP